MVKKFWNFSASTILMEEETLTEKLRALLCGIGLVLEISRWAFKFSVITVTAPKVSMAHAPTKHLVVSFSPARP